MLVQIRLLMNLKVVKSLLVKIIFVKQCLTPARGPMPEHFFVKRSGPPFDHAAFINQTAGELCESAAFRKHLAIDHFIERYTKSLPLFNQDLDVSRYAWIYQLVTDLAYVGR